MAVIKRFFRGILKLSLILISLLCLSVVCALITMKLVSRADLVKVPPITGKDTMYALEQLNTIGLRLKIEGQEFSELSPENFIISQDPQPSELIRRDRAVKVILSKGSEKVNVPDLVEEPWLRAQTLIQEAGLKIGRMANTHAKRIEHNHIIAQHPTANSMVPRGSVVDLLLSEGGWPKGYYMPDLKGLHLDEAIERLRDVGVLPGQITYEYDNTLPSNSIISQVPETGYRVFAGDKANLIVRKAEASNGEEAGIYTTLSYQVPIGPQKREVRILLHEGDDAREIFHEISAPGEKIELLIKTSRGAKTQIYLDGELIEERIL